MAVVVFRSKAGGEVIMMRGHVEPIFKQAGLIFHERGAFLAADLPSVVAALEKEINGIAQTEDPEKDRQEEEENNTPAMIAKVAVKTRFYPLMRLLRKADAQGYDVHWEPLS